MPPITCWIYTAATGAPHGHSPTAAKLMLKHRPRCNQPRPRPRHRRLGYYWYGIEPSSSPAAPWPTAVKSTSNIGSRVPSPPLSNRSSKWRARQGLDWLSTPDGRRGWASMLVEAGYKVYCSLNPDKAAPPGTAPPRPSPLQAAHFRIGSSHGSKAGTQWPGDGSATSPEMRSSPPR